jgi:hypothetical protein
MSNYPRTILKSVVKTKAALLAALELIEEIEQFDLENIQYETAKPLLEKFGEFSEPDRVETTQNGFYKTKPGTYTTDKQEYGYNLHSWRLNAREAKILAINPNLGK